jgi:hypothetical protein
MQSSGHESWTESTQKHQQTNTVGASESQGNQDTPLEILRAAQAS